MIPVLAQASNPAFELQQLICLTYLRQGLAPGVALVMVALGLLVALASGGSVRTASLVATVLIALAIVSFSSILGALGAGGGCPSQLVM
jgi:hypothetical protein